MAGKRVDTTHAQIRDGLRDLHVTVYDASMFGRGFPDLVCGYRGRLVLLEVKTPGGKLRQSQIDFFTMFLDCPVYVVESLQQACEKLGIELEVIKYDDIA